MINITLGIVAFCVAVYGIHRSYYIGYISGANDMNKRINNILTVAQKELTDAKNRKTAQED